MGGVGSDPDEDDLLSVLPVAVPSSDDGGGYYKHKERLLVAPVFQQQQKGGLTGGAFQVRVESTQSLTVKTKKQSQSSSPPPPSSSSSMLVASPFPDSVITDLLRKFGATDVSIRMGSRASSSFPETELDCILPVLFDDEDDDYNDEDRGEIANACLPSSSSSARGPSGVFVRARMIVRVGDNDGDDNENVKKNFFGLLRALKDKRLILAALDTIQDKRLHRHVSMSKSNTEISDNNNDYSSGTLWVKEFTAILPSEISPAAAEGISTFQTILPPCHNRNRAGLLACTDATSWSNFLMGVSYDRMSRIVNTKLLGNSRRGFWIDLQSTPSCWQETDSANERGVCTYSVSQGLFYPVAAATQISDGVATTLVSLDDLLPTMSSSSTDKKQFVPCLFSDSTSLDVVVLRNSSNVDIVNDPDLFQVDLQPACMQQTNDKLTPLRREDAVFFPVSLTRPTSTREPCLRLKDRRNAAESPTLAGPSITSPPLWKLNFSVLRTGGQANRGTLFTQVWNNDAECASNVSVVQTIPPMVHISWQSLQVTSSLLNGNGSVMSKEKQTLLSWTSIETHEIDFLEDGTVILRFAQSLPPSSTMSLSLSYDPLFLPFESFPGNANRGFELPPVHATFVSQCLGDSGSGSSAELYSNSVLLLAPLPDMSMPFNVISFTCTVYAFVIGSLLNLMTKKTSERIKYALYPEKKPVSKLAKLKGRLKDKMARFRQRGRKGATASTPDESTPPITD